MTILGIETLVYGVGDVQECGRFFDDFGLVCDGGNRDDLIRFTLPAGSHVVIKHRDDPSLPASPMEGDGVREVIWGVRDQPSLDGLRQSLESDREVAIDEDGTLHFATDFGIAMGLRLWAPIPVVTAPDPLNSPGRINRLNQHRKWRERARPKVISHVVFTSPDYQSGFEFMRDRLGFRLTDLQRGFGNYMRAPGSNHHHNLLLLNSNAPGPGMDSKLRFHHANFGVEDIDEIMTGANYMQRKGWETAHLGLGRHRIDSALFYYIPCPAGGEAEYGADADFVDDNWVPRDWINPLFGFAHYVHNLPPFLMEEPDWNFRYMTENYSPGQSPGG